MRNIGLAVFLAPCGLATGAWSTRDSDGKVVLFGMNALRTFVAALCLHAQIEMDTRLGRLGVSI